MELPHNSKNPRIILGYDNKIKLMVDQTNAEKWSQADFERLRECKYEYLEKRLGHSVRLAILDVSKLEKQLGYKITRLDKTISHDDYEKNLEKSTDFFKRDKKK